MSRVTLSRVTCPFDVSQFSHLGKFVARDKICSERQANVSGRQQKHFVHPQLGAHVARLSLTCLAALEDTPNTMQRATLSPSLAKALYSLCT